MKLVHESLQSFVFQADFFFKSSSLNPSLQYFTGNSAFDYDTTPSEKVKIQLSSQLQLYQLPSRTAIFLSNGKIQTGHICCTLFFFCSCLIFSIFFETCLSYWLFPKAFLLSASQAWLPFSFCLFLLLLFPCWADAFAGTRSHKSNQRLTLGTLSADGCPQILSTVSSQEQKVHTLVGV